MNRPFDISFLRHRFLLYFYALCCFQISFNIEIKGTVCNCCLLCCFEVTRLGIISCNFRDECFYVCLRILSRKIHSYNFCKFHQPSRKEKKILKRYFAPNNLTRLQNQVRMAVFQP